MSVTRPWRAEQLVPGDVIIDADGCTVGRVTDCVGAGDGTHVVVTFESGIEARLPRSQVMQTTKGGA